MASKPGWATAEFVLEVLGYDVHTLGADDRVWLDLCVDAANSAVALWRPDLPTPSTPGGGDKHIVLGVSTLASRWYQRRGNDVAAFAEFGGPPPAIDRDIEQLLRINRAHAPVIA